MESAVPHCPQFILVYHNVDSRSSELPHLLKDSFLAGSTGIFYYEIRKRRGVVNVKDHLSVFVSSTFFFNRSQTSLTIDMICPLVVFDLFRKK